MNQNAPKPTSDGIDVQELMTRCLGNLQFAQRVVAKFQARLEVDLAELDLAVQQSDATGVARIAHRIKGASANVAAGGLLASATGLEELALAQDVVEAAGVLAELRREQARFALAAGKLGSPAGSCF